MVEHLKRKVFNFLLDFNQANNSVECVSANFHMLGIHKKLNVIVSMRI